MISSFTLCNSRNTSSKISWRRMRQIRKPISARYTSHISLITAEPSLEGGNPLLKKADCFCWNRPKHKGDSKNTHISVSNFGSWLEFSVLSLPVSFCQGLTSLRHCPLPRAVPCTIHQKKKNQKSFSVRFTVMFLLHRHVSDGLCSPWNHRPVCRVSSVPRLLCTI